MKKIISLILIMLMSISFASAETELSFDTPSLTDPASAVEIAAAVLNDYETSQNENLQIVGCTYIKYRYQNEDAVFLDYYIINPDRSLNVFPDGNGKATATFQPVSLTSGVLNEKTSESVHKTVLGMYQKANGVKVLESEYIKASDITQAWMRMSKPADETEETNITGKWFNIKGSDVYTFEADGTGTHDSLSIIYTLTDNTLAVMENITDITPNVLTIDQAMGFTRLIAADTYYVQEQEFYRLSSAARAQTTEILTSVEFWKAAAAINYLQFSEGGTGWFLLQGETDPLKWEFVDNDTIKMTVTTSIGTNTLTVNVVNNQGAYLLTDDYGKVLYSPKN